MCSVLRRKIAEQVAGTSVNKNRFRGDKSRWQALRRLELSIMIFHICIIFVIAIGSVKNRRLASSGAMEDVEDAEIN